MKGGRVCANHGGKAPQTLAKSARVVLEEMVAPALVQMADIIRNPVTPPAVKLAAVRDVLDRNGYKAPTQIEFLTDAMIEADIERLEREQGLT